MKNKLIAFVIFCIFKIVAQPPGYQGKRLSIQYQPSFNLNIPGINSKGNTQFYLPNAIAHGGYIDYVVGRRTSLGGKVSFLKNHVNMLNKIDNQYKINSYDEFIYTKILENKLEFLVKHYHSKKGNLAPFGAYTQFGLGKHWFSAISEKYSQTIYTNSNIYSFSLAFGKERIFRDCIILDINFKLSLALDVNSPKNGFEKIGIVSGVNDAILTQNIFGFNIGIGYLAPKLKK